jgi:hypothetical protein
MRIRSMAIFCFLFLLTFSNGYLSAAEAAPAAEAEPVAPEPFTGEFTKEAVEKYFNEQISRTESERGMIKEEIEAFMRTRGCGDFKEEAKIFLRAFFGDEEVKRVFLAEDKFPKGLGLPREDHERLACAHFSRKAQVGPLCERWGFVDKSHNTFTLSQLELKIVLKLAMFNWHNPDLPGGPVLSPWQNASRLLFAARIVTCVKERRLTRVLPVHKWALPFHCGERSIDDFEGVEFSDDHLAVVADQVKQLYDSQEKRHFEELFDAALAGNPEAMALLREMLVVIKFARLWNVTAGNVLFVGPYVIAFVDTEKQSRGRDDQYFFMRKMDYILGNINAGCGSLAETLTRTPEDAERLRLCFMLFVAGEDDSVEALVWNLGRYRS